MMGTGFKTHKYGRTPHIQTCGLGKLQRHGLSVCLPGSLVPTFGQDIAILYDDTAHPRIGARADDSRGKVQRSLHVNRPVELSRFQLMRQ